MALWRLIHTAVLHYVTLAVFQILLKLIKITLAGLMADNTDRAKLQASRFPNTNIQTLYFGARLSKLCKMTQVIKPWVLVPLYFVPISYATCLGGKTNTWDFFHKGWPIVCAEKLRARRQEREETSDAEFWLAFGFCIWMRSTSAVKIKAASLF